MDLKVTSQSGSLESSDLMVVLTPAAKGAGRTVELESTVIKEFGESIKKDINFVLDKMKISDVHLKINDRGALSPTIKARVESAIIKSAKGKGE